MNKSDSKNVSEIRYRRLFETARDGIIILDSETQKISDANPFIAKLLGFTRVELIGKELYEIGLLGGKASSKEILQKFKKVTEVLYDDPHIRSRASQQKTVEIVANSYEEDGKTAIQCNIRDLTERKKAEIELFQSKQRLEALMNALPVGVTFSSDVTCEYITGNSSLVRSLEIKEGDNISASTSDMSAAGRKLKHFIGGRLIGGNEMPMQRAIAENRTVGPLEIQVQLPSGKQWFMEAIGAPIHDVDGKVVASVAVNVDLTERKRAEEASRLERLIEQEKVKIGFIADATHELRTPLAIIKGNVDLALRGSEKKLSVATKETFDAINNEVMHLSNLLSDLTILTTKGGDFQRKIISNKIDLKDLINKLAKRHMGFADKKDIKIKVKDLPAATIVGDELYLEKLFSNIIANAVSYGKEGGLVNISGSRTSSHVQIQIEDDGIGISDKDLPHIFERFYRAESSRSKDHGGTGLGLAIVKWIAEAHGGTVTATSKVGKGSTFFVTLPVAE